MNKRTQEKLEREKLKQMIDNNPKLKDFLDAAVNETGNKDLQELIAPVLKDTFDKIRLQGIQTGWYAHAMQCKAKILACKTLEDAVNMFTSETEKAAEKLNIKPEMLEENE